MFREIASMITLNNAIMNFYFNKSFLEQKVIKPGFYSI